MLLPSVLLSCCPLVVWPLAVLCVSDSCSRHDIAITQLGSWPNSLYKSMAW